MKGRGKIVTKTLSNSKGLDPLRPTINSSLAHLAYGHLSFVAWRELKKKSNEEK
ncbi:hypothetical protein ULMS_24500 [Patiriisocius marinistellae]|uniref:Uncharacterized protein n=1 Tax=Patiriisocius marinistellae TaxID=2494560 RepID=A0A5J4G073_9FLAO|nr:hypothetical protein [Patiriisocius marinistellae]GEQ86942.1 hypothetical protein ULMS_24500 [Patiriisocius marinistellae]